MRLLCMGETCLPINILLWNRSPKTYQNETHRIECVKKTISPNKLKRQEWIACKWFSLSFNSFRQLPLKTKHFFQHKRFSAVNSVLSQYNGLNFSLYHRIQYSQRWFLSCNPYSRSFVAQRTYCEFMQNVRSLANKQHFE